MKPRKQPNDKKRTNSRVSRAGSRRSVDAVSRPEATKGVGGDLPDFEPRRIGGKAACRSIRCARLARNRRHLRDGSVVDPVPKVAVNEDQEKPFCSARSNVPRQS